jgi:hypothetical protein
MTCPSGKFSSAGLHICTNCSSGFYSDRGMLCQQCKSGFFSDQGVAVCGQCEAGTSSKPGSLDCDACQVGQYQQVRLQASCIKCPSTKFQDMENSTSCAQW